MCPAGEQDTLNLMAEMSREWLSPESGLKVIEKWGKMEGSSREEWILEGKGDRKWLHLGYLQGDSVWQNIPKRLLLQGGRQKERESACFKVQKLFADVQIRSKSPWRPEGAQMLFEWNCLLAQRLQND